jgi:amino acid transporter
MTPGPPPSTSGQSTPNTDADRAALHQFGYAQQLLRDMGGFSNFAISFSIISILTGAVTLYGTGLQAGGPVVMGIGWPLVTIFVLFVAASMAELASAIPTSGALYHWSALLGGARWGWLTGWLNLLGLVATIASIDYGCAGFLAPLLHMSDTPQSDLKVCVGLLLSQAILNHVGIRAVARLNDLSAVYHIVGVAVIVGGLAFFAAKQPVSYLYTQQFTTLTGHPYWYAFMSGLLLAQWTYTGYDASAHTIEETRDARVRAPWGIFLSVAVSGLFGYLLIAFVTLAIKDLPATAAAANPFRYVFEQAFPHSSFPGVVLWIVTAAQWFCGLACVTSTSRMMFALSRDNGMPLSRLWSNVSRRYRTPAAAVWLSVGLALLLPCALLAYLAARHKMDDFPTLYSAMTGISTIGLYLSYGIPILLKLLAIRRGVWGPRTNGPWNLGNWSVAVNVIAVLWVAFITVLFVLPPNELTGTMFGGTLVLLLVYYLVGVRGRFKGPVPQAVSEVELRRIESEYETHTGHA